jgi:hypothetical protein
MVAAIRRRGGVFVYSIDEDSYRGPSLQQWDYFDSPELASVYIGCEEDAVSGAIRDIEVFGLDNSVAVGGVKFIPATMVNEHFRPPMSNPKPRKARLGFTRKQLQRR